MVIISCFIIFLFSAEACAKPPKQKVGNMSELRENAMAGSPEAAMGVVEILYRDITSTIKPHPAEAWLKIAAENGSANGQHAYAQILLRDSPNNRETLLRARYWLAKSAQQKFAPAQKMLLRIDKELQGK
jgi:TPR repeat protein